MHVYRQVVSAIIILAPNNNDNNINGLFPKDSGTINKSFKLENIMIKWILRMQSETMEIFGDNSYWR